MRQPDSNLPGGPLGKGHGVEGIVTAARFQQLGVRAALNYAAMIHHHDQVGARDGREAGGR